MTTIRTIARAIVATVCTMTATGTISAADKPKAAPPTKPLVNRPAQQSVLAPRDSASGLPTGKRQHAPLAGVAAPRDAASGLPTGVVKPAGTGGVSAQKVTDGWGLAKGIGNIIAGAGKVVTGKVDSGLDQVKHGGEQVKASTDKDTTNDPSKQPKGENTGK